MVADLSVTHGAGGGPQHFTGILSLHPRTPKLCANIHHPSKAREHRCHFREGENESQDDEVTCPCSYWNGFSQPCDTGITGGPHF